MLGTIDMKTSYNYAAEVLLELFQQQSGIYILGAECAEVLNIHTNMY